MLHNAFKGTYHRVSQRVLWPLADAVRGNRRRGFLGAAGPLAQVWGPSALLPTSLWSARSDSQTGVGSGQTLL